MYTTNVATLSVADRLEVQQQAMKGLVQTLPSIRGDYCQFLSAIPMQPGSTMTPALRQIVNFDIAVGEIFEAVTKVNSLHACLAISVVAHCTATAFREIAGEDKLEALRQILTPLDKIVERKVWSMDEREKLFTLCFKILGTFGEKYAHLIMEVRHAFPEETKDVA